jgi:hypothetical protein
MQGQWELIAKYDGTGDWSKNNFAINYDLWKVYWWTDTDDSFKDFPSFSVYFIGQDNRLFYSAEAHPDNFYAFKADGVSYGIGKGVFTIDVYAENVKDWGFTVYAYK